MRATQTQHRDGTKRIRRNRQLVCRLCAVALAALLLVVAGAAGAGELYFSAGVGISAGTGDTGGSTPFFDNYGDDTDTSASYGFAFGWEMPMNEPLPEQWQHIIPRWPVLAEFEAVGGRDYELLTNGGDPYRTDFETWTVLHNLRFDIPVSAPFEWAFGRIPILHPVTWYVGVGVGISIYDIVTTDNVSRGKDDGVEFAWQASTGLSYSVSEYVSIDVGYRYIDLGSADFDLSVGPTDFGNFTLDLSAHEFASAVRMRFFGIPLRGRYR